MKNKVYLALLIFLLVAGILLPGCGGNASKDSKAASAEPSAMSAEIAKIYEEAKKEGKVVYWAPDEAEISKLREGFSKKFPGIEVELFYTQPPKALEKIITEANANQTNLDVFASYYNDINLLLDRDLVKRYEWNKVFGIDPKIIHFDNRGIIGWHTSIPLVYNTNLVKENEVPKSWEELTDPKWKGKILLESRGNAFSILSYEWGADKTINYVKDLMKQNPLIIQGGEPAMQALANGQAAVGIGTYAYKVKPMQGKGAPVEWAKVGPIPLVTQVNGVMKNAPHPNAGLLWTYFITSADGLKARLAAGGGERMVGPDSGPMGKLMEEKKIKAIVEVPDKKEVSTKVEKEVKKILSSLK